MARRKRRRYEMKTMDQIDMTPLLDLTFLLLIVFMISMPLMEYGTKIEPPAMNSDELPLDNIKSVSITEAGTIMFGNQAVSKEELVEKLKALKATDPKMNLLLRADGSRKYNDVISLMALIRSAGFADVTLEWQMAAFAVVALAGSVWVRRWRALNAGVNEKEVHQLQNMDEGQLVQVAAFDAQGRTKVQYRGAEWMAQAEEGQEAVAGVWRIVEIKGNVLVIRKN